MQKYKMKEIGNIISGGTPSTNNPSYWDGEIPWITPKDLSKSTDRYIYNGERNLTLEGLNNSSANLLPLNSVLLSSRAAIGYLALAGTNLCTNQGFKSIICNENIVLPKYLYYLLKTKIDDLISIASGSTFLELSKTALENYEIDIHNKDFQQHIVNTIGSIDDLIEKTNKINEKIIKLSLKLFDLIIKKKEYETSSLKDELSLLKDGTHNPPKRINNGVPLLTGINIEKGFINYKDITYISYNDYLKIHSKYCPKENDLLITKIGTLGKVAIIRKTDLPIAIHCNSALMRFKNIAFSTAYFILCSNDFKNEFHSHKNQTVQEFINLEQISNLTIKIPDKKYDSTFEKMLLLLSNNNYKLKYFEILKNILLNKFFK